MAKDVTHRSKIDEETKPVEVQTKTVDVPVAVPPTDDVTAPVNLGAKNVTEMAREISEGSGDPLRDKKLMEQTGSLYDPATSINDTAGIEVGPDAPMPDQTITPQTRAEMEAGKEALAKRQEGIVKEGGPVPSLNEDRTGPNILRGKEGDIRTIGKGFPVSE